MKNTETIKIKHTGLSSKDVEERQKKKLTNKVKKHSEKSYLSIILKNTFTFYNLLLAIVTFLFIIANVELTKYSFLLYALANTLIAIIQEAKAKHTVDKLSLITAPVTIAIRNGEEIEIKSEDIVKDDIIKISISDQIPADCIVISGHLETNESMLTGESLSIKKDIGSNLLAGSFAVAGECYAVVTEVGNNTYINKIQSKTKNIKVKKSKLMVSIASIIKVIGFLIIPIALLNYFKAINWATLGLFLKGVEIYIDAIRSSGSLIVGMIPSGMILLTSSALAVGIVRLIRKNTLVQDLYSIESLARANVICLDKTGTLTDGTMSIENIYRLNISPSALKTIMGSYLNAAMGTNQTNAALVEEFSLNNYYGYKHVLPFSSIRKYSAVNFTEIGVYALGAPEFLVDLDKYPDVVKIIKENTEMGFRVLALCRGNKRTRINKETNSIDGKVEPVALFIISDNIRKEAKTTIEWFIKNGLEIKIISGDNALTVSKIAEQAGVPDAKKCISLENMSDEDVINAASRFTVFGRVSPEQKALLVRSLQKDRKNVAMVGDGVNDILALKTADCSITVASGSEATKSISQVVLLDSDFSNLPNVVYEGRRVINNIQLTSTLFLMKTFFIMITSLFSLLALPSYEFRLEQFSLIQLCVIGIPGLILSLQESKTGIKGSFLKNVIMTAVPAALLLVVPVLAVYLFNAMGIISNTTKIPLSVVLSTIAAYSVLYRLCKPFNKTKIILFTVMIFLGVAILSIAPDSILVPDFMEGRTVAEILSYYLDSLIYFFRFDLFNTTILKYFGLTEYIFMGCTLLLCSPLYAILSKMVSNTVTMIQDINPDILSDDELDVSSDNTEKISWYKKIFKKKKRL